MDEQRRNKQLVEEHYAAFWRGDESSFVNKYQMITLTMARREVQWGLNWSSGIREFSMKAFPT